MNKEKKQFCKVISILAFCVFTIAPQQCFNQLRHIVHNKLHAEFLKDIFVHNYFEAVTK